MRDPFAVRAARKEGAHGVICTAARKARTRRFSMRTSARLEAIYRFLFHDRQGLLAFLPGIAYAIIIVALVVLAVANGVAVLADQSTCTAAPDGSLRDAMTDRVLYTRRVGIETVGPPRSSNVGFQNPVVAISLEHALRPGWTCIASWSVEIALPHGVSLATGVSGNTASRTGLGRAETAEFEIVFDEVHVATRTAGLYRHEIGTGEHRERAGFLAVRLVPTNDPSTPITVPDVPDRQRTDGVGRWHFPVRFYTANRPKR